ncbi:MAG: hypothetical protein ACKVOK_12700 [Flavobacteriales bacterium]
MDILDQPTGKTNSQSRSIEEVIRDGYEFRFGDYLSEMFNLFGRTFGFLMGHSGIMVASYLIMYIILLMFFFSVIFGGVFDLASQQDPAVFLESMLWKFIAIWLIVMAYVVGWVLPFRAGTYTFLMTGRETRKYQFSDFFIAMKTKWAKIVGLTLIIHLLAFGILFLTYYLWLSSIADTVSSLQNNRFDRDLNPFFMFEGLGWIFLSYIPLIFILISASLSVPLLLFKTDSVIDALVSSMKIVIKKWFYFFGLFVLVYILTIAGIFVCVVGFLATMHFFPLVIFAIYEDIFIKQGNQSV